jgi:hypothetical protein
MFPLHVWMMSIGTFLVCEPALTTVAFDQSGPRRLGISDLFAEPEGPTFISYKVARSRLDRLRFVTQDPKQTSSYLTCYVA